MRLPFKPALPTTDQTQVVPNNSDYHVRRARRAVALTRIALGAAGISIGLTENPGVAHPTLAVVGFAVIAGTAIIHARLPSRNALQLEEALAATASILIVGLQDERVGALSALWLSALAAGVVARGGRLHWLGRVVVGTSLALPEIRSGALTSDQAGLILAAVGVMFVSGKLASELDFLLAKARYDADHDDLTGLLSRAAFRRTLEGRLEAAQGRRSVSLLLFDIDRFEVVNKTAGHTAGDALLVGVGQLLRTLTDGSGEELAGRLGGDEFALIVEGDGEEVAKQLLAGLPAISDLSRGVSGSVGIAQAPRDGQEADSLFRAAAIALRVAKLSSGTNQISVYAGSSLSGHGMQNARAELARLIGGEGLTMAVQPIVDLRTGEVHAYEALARFGVDSQGSPLHWFSLADELGERESLERACMKAALTLFAQRPQLVGLAVNVSAAVLLEQRTLELLASLEDLSGLIIEVTEEALVQTDSALSSAVKPLREKGVRLAVDDMGAGYSGLRQITVVHPSYLKLDRALVSGIDRDRERAALVEALVTYAKRVDCLLVAEGVETEEELDTLQALGVPLAQGFLLSRPGPPWPAIGRGALAKLRAGVSPDQAAVQDDSKAATAGPRSSLRAA